MYAAFCVKRHYEVVAIENLTIVPYNVTLNLYALVSVKR